MPSPLFYRVKFKPAQFFLLLAVVSGLCLTSCGGDDDSDPEPEAATHAVFDLAAMETDFYAIPYPNDLRIDSGQIDLSTFPNPSSNFFLNMILEMSVQERTAWCQNQGSMFAFDGNLDVTSLPQTPADTMLEESVAWLVALDPDSPDYGKRLPLRFHYFQGPDNVQPGHLLTVAPYQGVTLKQDTTYACILWKGLKDMDGLNIGPTAQFRRVLSGNTDSAEEDEAAQIFQPLREYLQDERLDQRDVIAASVFTTWHSPNRLKEIFDQAMQNHSLDVNNALVQTDEYPDYYVLEGDLDFPQFQAGTQPFDIAGTMVFDGRGNLVQQGVMKSHLVVTLPKEPMPADGYPLCFYIHGSGGRSDQCITRGRDPGPGLPNPQGEGPSMHLAQMGIACVSMAMPLNPERYPGATDLAYLNIRNLPALRGTFRQGTLELGMLLRWVEDLQLPGDIVPGAVGPGEHIFFNSAKFCVTGQSMGAMYTNLWGPLEPSLNVLIPTGSGGQWTLVLITQTIFPAAPLINTLFGINSPEFDDLHPAMVVGQMAMEPVDPVVMAPHIMLEPFDGIPAKSVYYPAGYIDDYFAPPSISALALAMGFDLAGDLVYPQLKEELALVGRSHLSYPVEGNVVSNRGEVVTGVIVQYEEDGIKSGHHVAFQLDAPKYQYRCLLREFFDSGRAVVHEPRDLGDGCP